MKRLAAALFAIALLVGCGGSGSSQPSGSIKVTMNEYKFDPNTITAAHGKVVFFLVNTGTVSHDLIIKDSSGKTVSASQLISAGDSNVFTVDNIDSGTYTFVCDQPGHEASGMKGALTIT
jgi:plastocyanin